MNISEFDNIIQQLDQTVMSHNIKQLPIGLFNGKMGLCFYFSHLAKILNSPKHQSFAEKLLGNIHSSIDKVSSIDFNTGVSGIAWGIHYLVENKFVTGNINHILKDVDDLLFRMIHLEWLNDNTKKRIDFLWLLFYYSDRLQTIKNKTEKEITQKLVIRLINHIEDNFADIPWETPTLFDLAKHELALYILLLSRFYSFNFYNYKIVKIWDNISNEVLSSIPIQHANRLAMLFAIKKVLACRLLPEWAMHAKLLEENINHKRIINQEFLNKNITLRCGISGYCLLLSNIDDNILSSQLKIQIIEKIKSSEVWNNRFNPSSESINESIGLATGYSGVSLIYYSLLKPQINENGFD